MAQNQTEISRLEQRSVIKFLVAGKGKPHEIYRRMCDMYGEACLGKKNLYKWDKHEFTHMTFNDVNFRKKFCKKMDLI